MVKSNNFIGICLYELIEGVADIAVIIVKYRRKRVGDFHSVHIKLNCNVRLMIESVVALVHLVACSYEKIVSAMTKSCTSRVKRYRRVTIFQLSSSDFVPVLVVFCHGKAGNICRLGKIILTTEHKIVIFYCVKSAEHRKFGAYKLLRSGFKGVAVIFNKQFVFFGKVLHTHKPAVTANIQIRFHRRCPGAVILCIFVTALIGFTGG